MDTYRLTGLPLSGRSLPRLVKLYSPAAAAGAAAAAATTAAAAAPAAAVLQQQQPRDNSNIGSGRNSSSGGNSSHSSAAAATLEAYSIPTRPRPRAYSVRDAVPAGRGHGLIRAGRYVDFADQQHSAELQTVPTTPAFLRPPHRRHSASSGLGRTLLCLIGTVPDESSGVLYRRPICAVLL